MPALGLCFFVLALSVFGLTTLSATVPRWLVIYGWAGLICVVFALRGRVRADGVDIAALALFLWASVTMLWTPDIKQGAYALTNAAALLTVFLWLRAYPHTIPRAAAVGVWVLLLLQWIYPADMGGHGNRNFQTEAVLLLCAITAFGRPLWAVPTILAGLVYLVAGNASKIEYAAFLAVALALSIEQLGKLLPHKVGDMDKFNRGVAGKAVVRPRNRVF